MNEAESRNDAAEQKSGGSSCLKIAGVGCLIIILVAVAGGIYVAKNWKAWSADAMVAVCDNAVKESELPDDQKAAIKGHIDRLATGFKNGDVSVEQLGQVLKELAEGPILPLGLVYAVEKHYVLVSALTEAEKKAASLSLQRFARGVVEKKINQGAINEVTAMIQEPGDDGDKQIKEKLTKEELTAFLAAVKGKADEAKIPMEPYKVDIAAEIGKAVDAALAQVPQYDT